MCNGQSCECWLLYYSLFIVFLHQNITDALTRATQVGGAGNTNNNVFHDVVNAIIAHFTVFILSYTPGLSL
jgi:hypothetical protein